jgi:hypothetical protein
VADINRCFDAGAPLEGREVTPTVQIEMSPRDLAAAPTRSSELRSTSCSPHRDAHGSVFGAFAPDRDRSFSSSIALADTAAA